MLNPIYFSVAFAVFNIARICLYKDTFKKLSLYKNNLDSHSITMWASWIGRNFFASCVFYLESGFGIETILTMINLLAISFITMFLVYRRIKYKSFSEKLNNNYL